MAEPLRVLAVVSELLFGGDENRLLALARTIDRSRFELSVLTLKAPHPQLDPYYGSMRAQYAQAGIDVLDLGEGYPNQGRALGSARRFFTSAAMLGRTLRGVCRIVRERRIDLIDTHGGPGGLIGAVAGVLTGRPRTLTTYHVEQWDPRWLWQVVHPWTLRAADTVFTDSDAVAESVRTFLHGRAPRILVIPNGVVPPRSDRGVADLRAAFGLPLDPVVRIVGQISSLFPTKGHGVLLEAAPAILRAQPNTAFLMVGFVRRDVTYRARLEARARELGIADRIRIVSYPGPIGDVWNVIDVQAHPSMLDSLPNAIIEGMALAKPAVVTSVGGIPTLVEDGVTGLVVPPGDADALARGLIRLLADEPYARGLARAARARYERGYTPEHMTRRIERAFLAAAGPQTLNRNSTTSPSCIT